MATKTEDDTLDEQEEEASKNDHMIKEITKMAEAQVASLQKEIMVMN